MRKGRQQELFNILKAKCTNPEEMEQERKIRTIGSLFLMGISIFLTLLNFLNRWWYMGQMTLILAAGFGVAALLAGVANKLMASSVVMGIAVAIEFSVFIVTGENEGFAALWVLLVPMLSMNLTGIQVGLLISIYYQIFLVGLFYTPLHQITEPYYTATFMIRFPILYFASFGASVMLVFQKQYYFLKVKREANYDGLTGIFNRHVFIQGLKESEQKEDLVIAYFDLNKLKLVNDTLGHDAGDEMIRGVAECMKIAFPAPMIAARIGGDEFAVIADLPYDEWIRSLNEFELQIAAWSGEMVRKVSVSIGCAYRREHPEATAEELLTIADAEMYKSKIASSIGTERTSRAKARAFGKH